MGLRSEICFRICHRMVTRRRSGAAGENSSTFDRAAYQKWRSSELAMQFTDNFTFQELAGLDVLDFGCGEGDLSFFLSNAPVHSIRGVDVNQERIASAKARKAAGSFSVTPEFFCASGTSLIDLDDASVDAILCFDVLEHVMEYQSIVAEWHRILRPGGKVLIWWVPWFHPYGPHIESLVPLPWAHVLFPERALLDTCARMYDHPDFKPRIWDVDPGTGGKKPNKWRSMTTLPEVNKLTMSRFEKTCAATGLSIEDRRLRGFGGGVVAKATHLCLGVPFLREFFSSSVAYRLRKSGA